MVNFFLELNCVYQALIATLFTWLVTLLGAALVFFFKNVKAIILDSMLALAGGVMIAASFWSLLSPAIEMAEENNINAWLWPLLGFISGGILLYYSDKLFTKISQKKDELKNSNFKRSLFLIFSITLHNIPEGLAVGVAFGSLIYDQTQILPAVLLALGIGIQNFPEGAAVSIPLRREGYSLKKSFFYGQLSGIVEPIFGVIGAILAIKVKLILPFLLSLAAGAMIYVVVEEIIPESQKNKNKSLIALFTLLGFSIMMVLDVALG